MPEEVDIRTVFSTISAPPWRARDFADEIEKAMGMPHGTVGAAIGRRMHAREWRVYVWRVGVLGGNLNDRQRTSIVVDKDMLGKSDGDAVEFMRGKVFALAIDLFGEPEEMLAQTVERLAAELEQARAALAALRRGKGVLLRAVDLER